MTLAHILIHARDVKCGVHDAAGHRSADFQLPVAAFAMAGLSTVINNNPWRVPASRRASGPIDICEMKINQRMAAHRSAI